MMLYRTHVKILKSTVSCSQLLRIAFMRNENFTGMENNCGLILILTILSKTKQFMGHDSLTRQKVQEVT